MGDRHAGQRQIWISVKHRDMLRRIAKREDPDRQMRTVVERLIEEAYRNTKRLKRLTRLALSSKAKCGKG